MSRRLLPLLLAPALLLGGCISLFPKAKPATLYSFALGPEAAAASAAPPQTGASADRVGLIFPPVVAPKAAAGDQLLTQTGPESAYIAGVRWVAPAAVLFGEATERAFAANSTRARLLSRQEIAGAEGFLRLEVTDFEARYAAPEAAPVVRVALTATLAHRSGVYAADRTFVADIPAAENGARAIVDAYGQAVRKVTGELVSWTDANADKAAEEGPAPGGAVLPSRFGAFASPPAAPRATTSTRTTSTVTSTSTRPPQPRP